MILKKFLCFILHYQKVLHPVAGVTVLAGEDLHHGVAAYHLALAVATASRLHIAVVAVIHHMLMGM